MQDKGTVKQADEERKRPERVERCCRGSMARFMQVAQKSVVLAGLPARGFAECDRGLWRGLMGTGGRKGGGCVSKSKAVQFSNVFPRLSLKFFSCSKN